MENDKQLPQAPEVEEIVIGSILLDSEAFNEISYLPEDCFYDYNNRIVFNAIKRLKLQSIGIDLLTVAQELKRTSELEQIGGVLRISQYTDKVGSAVNIAYHAQILNQKRLLRELYQTGVKVSQKAFVNDSDPLQMIRDIRKSTDQMLNSVSTGKDAIHISDALKSDFKAYESRVLAKNKGSVTGVRTGFTELDRSTFGWQDNNLIILAGRPGMGKTSLAMHFARYSGVPTLIFSVEMSESQLTQRLVITESEIDGYDYKTGKVRPDQMPQVEQARGRLEQLPMYIDDTTPLRISEMKTKAMRFRNKHEGKILIVVDYLQLIKSDDSRGKNREQEIADVSRTLKEISKVCMCPVIALAQLNRSVETRGGDKKPQLSDLRESGQIEQDADLVLFIHRPEYYGITTDALGNSTKGKAEIIVAKNRDGSVGIVEVGFIDHLTKFTDFNQQTTGLQPNVNFANDPF